MILRALLIVLEVLFITILNYYMASSYYSLDVLYCLPVIQTARFKALQSQSNTNIQLLSAIAVLSAVAWSLAEAAVTWPNFPVSAFLMNVITRAVTFMVIGRVITKIWKDKESSRKEGLAGLFGRLEFIKLFEEKLLDSQKTEKPFSLIFFNIDNFRALNELLGNQLGDKAHEVLAAVLIEHSRGNAYPSRIGSNEFVLLLADADEQKGLATADQIFHAADKIFKQRDWDIDLSYGRVTDTGNKKSVEEILRAAGENMYLKKYSKSK